MPGNVLPLPLRATARATVPVTVHPVIGVGPRTLVSTRAAGYTLVSRVQPGPPPAPPRAVASAWLRRPAGRWQHMFCNGPLRTRDDWDWWFRLVAYELQHGYPGAMQRCRAD